MYMVITWGAAVRGKARKGGQRRGWGVCCSRAAVGRVRCMQQWHPPTHLYRLLFRRKPAEKMTTGQRAWSAGGQGRGGGGGGRGRRSGGTGKMSPWHGQRKQRAPLPLTDRRQRDSRPSFTQAGRQCRQRACPCRARFKAKVQGHLRCTAGHDVPPAARPAPPPPCASPFLCRLHAPHAACTAHTHPSFAPARPPPGRRASGACSCIVPRPPQPQGRFDAMGKVACIFKTDAKAGGTATAPWPLPHPPGHPPGHPAQPSPARSGPYD